MFLRDTVQKRCKTIQILRHAARITARTALLLTCAVLLSAGSIEPSGDFLAEEHGVKRGVDLLREKLGPKARILRVEVFHDRITVLAQDPSNRRRFEAWRLEKMSDQGIGSEKVVGPESPANPALLNIDLEAYLFDFADVDLETADKLKKPAIERADLDNPAHVSSHRVSARKVSPSSTVQWEVNVESDGESATIYTNADGTIRGADLSQTHK